MKCLHQKPHPSCHRSFVPYSQCSKITSLQDIRPINIRHPCPRTPMLCQCIKQDVFIPISASVTLYLPQLRKSTSSSSSEFPEAFHPQRGYLNPLQTWHAFTPPPIYKIVALPNNQRPLRQRSPCILRPCGFLRGGSVCSRVPRRDLTTRTRYSGT
jgi:hypothetical protein